MEKFYICNTCGNLIEKIVDGGTTPSCCTKPMTELRAGSTDGSPEAHVPEVAVQPCCSGVNRVTVKVGKTLHPMTETHHIDWVEICTNAAVYRVKLDPSSAPEACFFIPCSEVVVAVYCYCNLHGLWVHTVL